MKICSGAEKSSSYLSYKWNALLRVANYTTATVSKWSNCITNFLCSLPLTLCVEASLDCPGEGAIKGCGDRAGPRLGAITIGWLTDGWPWLIPWPWPWLWSWAWGRLRRMEGGLMRWAGGLIPRARSPRPRGGRSGLGPPRGLSGNLSLCVGGPATDLLWSNWKEKEQNKDWISVAAVHLWSIFALAG